MTSSDQVPRFAVVTPYVAQFVLAQMGRGGLDSAGLRGHAAHLRAIGHPARALEFEAAVAQLRAAAADHRASTSPPISVDGSAEAEVVPSRAGSGHEFTTAEVAEVMGVTSRQVSNWITSGALAGRKLGRSWLVDAGSVEALQDLRRSA